MVLINNVNKNETLEKLKESNREIFIRGAGTQGMETLLLLSECGINISGFLDTSENKIGIKIGKYEVIHPNIVYGNKKKGTYFIISAVRYHYDEIKLEMMEHGLEETSDFEDFSIFCDDESDRNSHRKAKRKVYAEYMNVYNTLPYMELDETIFESKNFMADLDFVVTEYCNLKCKGCSHLIPYIKRPCHFDSNLIVRDLEKLLTVSRVFVIGIMGGEPLLYQNLAKILEEIASLPNIYNAQVVRIVTNGAMPMNEKVLKALKKIPIEHYVYISNYEEKSKYTQQIVQMCEKWDIPYYAQDYSFQWIDFGEPDINHGYTKEQLKYIYNNCAVANTCYQLIDGQFYSCARIPTLIREGYTSFDSHAYVDVRNSDENLEEQLYNFMYQTDYIEACQNCLGQLSNSKLIRKG